MLPFFWMIDPGLNDTNGAFNNGRKCSNAILGKYACRSCAACFLKYI